MQQITIEHLKKNQYYSLTAEMKIFFLIRFKSIVLFPPLKFLLFKINRGKKIKKFELSIINSSKNNIK